MLAGRPNLAATATRQPAPHGCINLPPDIAKTIFENIETGTPVIAYYREPVTLTNNAAKMSNAYSYVKPGRWHTGTIKEQKNETYRSFGESPQSFVCLIFYLIFSYCSHASLTLRCQAMRHSVNY